MTIAIATAIASTSLGAHKRASSLAGLSVGPLNHLSYTYFTTHKGHSDSFVLLNLTGGLPPFSHHYSDTKVS